MKKEHAVREGLFFVLVAALTGTASGCIGAPEDSVDERAGAGLSVVSYDVSENAPRTINLANDFGFLGVTGKPFVFAVSLLSAPMSKNDVFSIEGEHLYTDQYGVLNNGIYGNPSEGYLEILRGPGFDCTTDSDECWRHHAALAVQNWDETGASSQITISVTGDPLAANAQRKVVVRLLPNTPGGTAELDLAACTDIPKGSTFGLSMYDVDFAEGGDNPPGGWFMLEDRWSLTNGPVLQNIYLDQLWGEGGTIYRVKVSNLVTNVNEAGEASSAWKDSFFDIVLQSGLNSPCSGNVRNVFSSSLIDGSTRY